MELGDLLATPPDSLDVRCDARGVALRVRPEVAPLAAEGFLFALLLTGDSVWPLVLVVLLVLLVVFVTSRRRYDVRLTAEGLFVVHHLGPWRRRIAIAWPDVSSARHDPRLAAVVIERHDGLPVVLSAGAHPPSDLRWLSRVVDRGCRCHILRPRPSPPGEGAVALLLRAARPA